MALYVIGDLHLSFSSDKPMEVFGEHWESHFDKIKADWVARVSESDTVIIPGDVSWAMTFANAKADLEWIDALPGKKVIFKGNHDLWWVSKTKMISVFEHIEFVHNAFSVYNHIDSISGEPIKIALCGTRGWICPGEDFTGNDEKIYRRELLRLEGSIKMARDEGYTQIIGVLHFPPTNERKEASGFTEIFEKYGIEQVVYGHVHGKQNFKNAINGKFREIDYHLTSCDFLDFKLLQLL